MNAGKLPIESLGVLISMLNGIRSSLPPVYWNETILRHKLLNAGREVEACWLAYQEPTDTVQGAIADLYASLATVKLPSISSF